jgi:hypothetical protein
MGCGRAAGDLGAVAAKDLNASELRDLVVELTAGLIEAVENMDESLVDGGSVSAALASVRVAAWRDHALTDRLRANPDATHAV